MGTGRGDFGIGRFKIGKPNGDDVRQIERDQGLMTGFAQAKHPETRTRRVALQRIIERKSARQVVVVEVSAINALRHIRGQSAARNALRNASYLRM